MLRLLPVLWLVMSPALSATEYLISEESVEGVLSPEPVDEDPVTLALRTDCAAGDLESCWNLGPEARPQLIKALSPRCSNGELDRCLELAHMQYTWPPMDTAAAFELTRFSCEKGSPDGCRFHAQMLLNGEGAAPDVQKAIDLYRDLCAKDTPDTCEELARMGIDRGSKNLMLNIALKKADALLSACKAGKAESCTTLGSWYETSAWTLPSLPTTATALYGLGCEAGSDLGCLQLARMLSYDDISAPVGLADAMRQKAQERSCLAGEGLQCQALADDLSWSAPEDPAALSRAVELRKRACMAGEEQACAFLREIGEPEQLAGGGVVHTWKDVLALIEEGCADQRNPMSCSVLTLIYKDGLWGTPRDPVKALHSLGLACMNGARESCAAAAELSRSGELVPPDPERAFAFLQFGCVLDDGRSCLLVAQALQEGVGVKKSAKKAKKHFARACELGESEGCAGSVVTGSGCKFKTTVIGSDTGALDLGAKCSGSVKIKALDCPSECSIELSCGGQKVFQADGTCSPEEWQSAFLCTDQIRACGFTFVSGEGTLTLQGGLLSGTFSADVGGIEVGKEE